MAEPKRRKSAWKSIFLGLVVVCAGVLFDWHQVEPLAKKVGAYFYARTDKTASEPHDAPAVPVTATAAVQGSFPVVLTGLGNVQPYNTVLVRTRVDGQITKIDFKEGELVHEGDLLVEIDPRPFQAALDQAAAKKQQDQANLENAKRDLARYQSLARSDLRRVSSSTPKPRPVAQLTAQIAADECAGRERPDAARAIQRSGRRSPAAPGSGWSTKATSSMPRARPASCRSRRSNRSRSSSRRRKTRCRRLPRGSKPAHSRSKPIRRMAAQLLADGKLEVFNNEIDTASGTIRLKAAFDNKDHKLVAGALGFDQADRQRSEECRPHPLLGGPEGAERALRIRGRDRTTRSSCGRSHQVLERSNLRSWTRASRPASRWSRQANIASRTRRW